MFLPHSKNLKIFLDLKSRRRYTCEAVDGAGNPIGTGSGRISGEDLKNFLKILNFCP